MAENGRLGADFLVDLPLFKGSFQALARLILSNRVDVCDVPIARLTGRFLDPPAAPGGWSMEERTWFLATCAALLELKVGRLMPREEAPEDEPLGRSPDLAYARSLELAAFRRAANVLGLLMEEGSRFFTREADPPQEIAVPYADAMADVSPESLGAVAAALLSPPVVDLSHVAPIRASVPDGLRVLEERLGLCGSAPFSELIADCADRIEVVVRFLALLELYRNGKVELAQEEAFGDIKVRWAADRGGAA